jgi:hypothetical protein
VAISGNAYTTLYSVSNTTFCPVETSEPTTRDIAAKYGNAVTSSIPATIPSNAATPCSAHADPEGAFERRRRLGNHRQDQLAQAERDSQPTDERRRHRGQGEHGRPTARMRPVGKHELGEDQ